MAYAALKNVESSTTTFLDDYVDSLAALPNEVRRHFELMRSLDKEADTVMSHMCRLHSSYARRDPLTLSPPQMFTTPNVFSRC